ncbi:ATP-dependent helicase HrpB [Paeniglutamicibacter kerguelensis]|uniref:ATP-dependent helicase HrpB n=1 Tax=Paeniglutamicibacter kerguelensis TaxID=254788 RepID=UPI001AEA4BE9|nr:ATP-dependent helicase HrpB [Paeniglutamicibacter kerguelensis]
MDRVSEQLLRATPGTVDPGTFDLENIGRGLVFAQSLPGLARVLDAGGESGTAVIQAPPGTGKTTLVPPLVANLVLKRGEPKRAGGAGRILVTQPRRVAARSAARRLASLDGSPLGTRVGFSVRGENKAGPETLVEFVTPGILLRRLLADPGLDGIDAVIIDEVHERGLETDLLVGMLREVHELRGDLMLLAMSATLDAPRFAALIGDAAGQGPAAVVDCPSALHPLTVDWVPGAGTRLTDRGVSRTFLSHVAATAASAHARALAGNPAIDALVFLPGAWEVAEVAAQLRTLAPGTEVLELHGQVQPALQDRAVSGREAQGAPRIIVSTSLAESSLTVPGVRLVIDSGLAREPRRDATRGMSGLVTVSASRASCVQRAGRAARQGPGTVVRCFEEKSFAAAPAHPRAEITVADLASAALVLACWGAPGGEGLHLPEPPPANSLADALTVLAQLGAIDATGHATALGRRLASIPADPRLGRALLDGAPLVGTSRVAALVAMLAGDYRAQAADLGELLKSLQRGTHPQARAWKQESTRLQRLVERTGAGAAAATANAVSSGEDAAGLVVALAFPAQVARRVPGAAGATYLLASGTRAGLPAGSALAHHEWLAVAEVARAAGRDAAGTGALIRSAAPLDADTAARAASHLLGEETRARFAAGKLTARRVRTLGAIELENTPVTPTRAQGRDAVLAALRENGLGMLTFSASADALRRRLALVHRELGDPWPAMDDDSLIADAGNWLAPELEALAGGKPASALDLTDALRRLLPWPEASKLGELAPEHLAVPSGSNIRIEYPPVDEPGSRPVVSVKLQECFGLAESPRLVRGRVPILFHLLSPARRPLAVTDDLASFWSGPYSQVRAENRGRYPKHPWPEDPWTAPATRHVKRRMGEA